MKYFLNALIVLCLFSDTSLAEEVKNLSKELANPLAKMISVPIQLNYLDDIGIDDNGSQWQMNIQPVYPSFGH